MDRDIEKERRKRRCTERERREERRPLQGQMQMWEISRQGRRRRYDWQETEKTQSLEYTHEHSNHAQSRTGISKRNVCGDHSLWRLWRGRKSGQGKVRSTDVFFMRLFLCCDNMALMT